MVTVSRRSAREVVSSIDETLDERDGGQCKESRHYRKRNRPLRHVRSWWLRFHWKSHTVTLSIIAVIALLYYHEFGRNSSRHDTSETSHPRQSHPRQSHPRQSHTRQSHTRQSHPHQSHVILFPPLPRNPKSPLLKKAVVAKPKKPLEASKKSHRDLGGLVIKRLVDFSLGRALEEYRETYPSVVHSENDDRWVNVDDYRESKYDYRHCRHNSWEKVIYPTCNGMHETELRVGRFLSRGHFRDVWVTEFHSSGEYKIIQKTLRLVKDRKFSQTDYLFVRRDALVMERLTSSPRIVDIYGYCGTSILAEAVDDDFISDVMPDGGYVKHAEGGNLTSFNRFTPTQKLELSLQMAETIADLHGFKGGVIVHDDIKFPQFLRMKNGGMKLNDFNRAEIMLFDERKMTYCKYTNGGGYGIHRAPEEYSDEPLDEQIDVFSLGNIIYSVLTGLWNFYQTEDDEIVQSKVIKGKLPFIDERYLTSSYPEWALVTIMKKTLIFDPHKRPSIFQVVDFLKQAVEQNSRLEGLSGRDRPSI